MNLGQASPASQYCWTSEPSIPTLPGKPIIFASRLRPPPQALGAVVGDKVVQVVVAVLAETVAGLAAKVVRSRTAVFESLEFEDGQVETASVKRDQRAPKAVQDAARRVRTMVSSSASSPARVSTAVRTCSLIDLTHGYGDRDMKRDGKEVAACSCLSCCRTWL